MVRSSLRECSSNHAVFMNTCRLNFLALEGRLAYTLFGYGVDCATENYRRSGSLQKVDTPVLGTLDRL